MRIYEEPNSRYVAQFLGETNLFGGTACDRRGDEASIDSDEAGGPSFTWNDISLTGTPITELNGDDQISNPIPLGFDVSFYGNTYDSVRVHTNGWMSFTDTTATGTTTYTNQHLPTSAGPENLRMLSSTPAVFTMHPSSARLP